MRTVLVVAGLIVEKTKILLAQRRVGSHRGGLWEFPGGKIKESEEPRQALRRELQEELGIEVEVGTLVEAAFHVYPEYPILLLAYLCRVREGVPSPLGCQELRWVRADELQGFPMSPADEPIRGRVLFLRDRFSPF